jgi:CarD family transcriptional regulator
MFNLHDRVVYPGHGVARIARIITKSIDGHEKIFYELKFINKDMTILVPVEASSIIRHLTEYERIDDIFKFLASQPIKRRPHHLEMPINWKQRNKEYQSKLRTGNLMEISEIYRELKHIEHYKELSFCEKNLLTQTEMLLAEELALIKKIEEEEIVRFLRGLCSKIHVTGGSRQQQP